jgi:transposase-like protein
MSDSMSRMDNLATVSCPECGAKMHKMGKTWSGRKQVQRYRCPKCGRTHAPVSETEEHKEEANGN